MGQGAWIAHCTSHWLIKIAWSGEQGAWGFSPYAPCPMPSALIKVIF